MELKVTDADKDVTFNTERRTDGKPGPAETVRFEVPHGLPMQPCSALDDAMSRGVPAPPSTCQIPRTRPAHVTRGRPRVS